MKSFIKQSWLVKCVALMAILFVVVGQESAPVSAAPVQYHLMAELLRNRNANAKAAPNGCAKAFTVEKIDNCNSEQGKPTFSKCESCRNATDGVLRGGSNQEKAQTAANQCTGAGDCGISAANYDPQKQLDAMTRAGTLTSTASTCLGSKVQFNKTVATESGDCKKALEGCSGIGAEQSKADRNKRACNEAKKNAEDTAKDQKDKKDAVDKQEDKNKDNAKKEGGGMPQMPQIPQQKEDPKEDAKASDPSTSSAPTVATETKPEIESSKIGDSKNGIATPTVGFVNGTDTASSTIATPGVIGSFAGLHEEPKNKGLGDTNLGGAATPTAGTLGGTGGGGPGIGGGTLNTTGASVPGDGKGEAGANPYEVNAGGGGKLGAPKGLKSGGESDSALDAGAKDNFKNDLGIDKPVGVADGEKGAGEGSGDDGYSIFKMIKYRYTELKKRGNI